MRSPPATATCRPAPAGAPSRTGGATSSSAPSSSPVTVWSPTSSRTPGSPTISTPTPSGDYELLTMSDSETALAPEVVDGRLQVSGRDYYSMLLAEQNLPTEGETTVVLDIEKLADSGGSENSLFLGFAQDADNRAVAWYNRNTSRLGFDIVTDGQSFGGWGDVPADLRPGDRLAVTLSGRWLTAYRWHDGQWDRIHTAPVNGNDDITDPQVRAEYRPAVGFRATSGTLAVDNLELRTR